MKYILTNKSLNYSLIWVSIYILTLFVCDGESRKIRPPPGGPSKKPKIWLSSYSEQDSFDIVPGETQLQDEDVYDIGVVSKNGSEYIITSDAREVTFACEADYPVMWKLPHPEQFSGVSSSVLSVVSKITSSFDEDLALPKNIKFYSYLRMLNELFWADTLSGDLVCHSIENIALQESIYVYTEVQYPMQNMGQTVQVNVSSSTQFVVLPCRPVHPTAISIKLQKLTPITYINSLNVTLEWTPVPTNESITFDPRKGFILDKNSLPNVYGEYECFVEGEEDLEHAFITVKAGMEPTFDFEPRSVITSKNAHLSIDANLVQCCTGNTNAPAVGDSFLCRSAAECDFLKPVFMHEVLFNKKPFTEIEPYYIRKRRFVQSNYKIIGRLPNSVQKDCFQAHLPIYLTGSSKLLLCHGPGIDVVAQYVTAFRADDAVSKAYKRLGVVNQLQIFDLADEQQHPMVISNKIQFTFEAILWTQQYNSYQMYPGLMNYGDIAYGGNPGVLGRRRRRLQRPYYAPIYQRDYFFKGESIIVTCMTHPLFYAKGGWMRLNWKNGSVTLIDNMSEHELQRTVYGQREQGYEYDSLVQLDVLTARLGGDAGNEFIRAMIVQLNEEMKSFDCFAPVWNTGAWEKHTYEMNVRTADLPEIEISQNDNLVLKLEESGVKLNCSLKLTKQSRLVQTQLYWEKDGKRMSYRNGIGVERFVNDGNTTTALLTLHNVTLGTHGAYKCIAKNIAGRVEKVVNIFVDDGKEGAGMVILIGILCVSLLVLIFGGLVWRHWHLRKSISTILSKYKTGNTCWVSFRMGGRLRRQL